MPPVKMKEFCGIVIHSGSSRNLVPTESDVDCSANLSNLIINCLFVILCVCIFVWMKTLAKLEHATVIRFQEDNSRWILTLCLIMINLCEIGDSIISEYIMDVYHIHVIVPPYLNLIAAVMTLLLYLAIQSSNRHKLLLVLLLYWILILGSKIPNLIYLHGIGLSAYHLRVLINYFYVIIYTSLLLVEISIIWTQRYLCRGLVKSFNPELDISEVRYVHSYVNLFSKTTFWWMNPVLRLGSKRPLEFSDLGKLPEEELVQKHFNNFLDIYTHEKEKLPNGADVSLWKCIFKAFWQKLVLAGIFKILADLVEFVGPMSIGVIIKYVSNSQNSTVAAMPRTKLYYLTLWDFLQNGYVMAVLILLASLAQSSFKHAFFHIVTTEGTHMRSSLQAMVYSKALKLSTWSKNGESIDSGSIINHMSADCSNLMMFFIMGHFMWTIPIQISILLVLLYFHMGYSALLGASVIVVLAPVQYFISKSLSDLQKKTLEITDQRIQYTNELLQSIKLLKLYSWEFLFCGKIQDVRKTELKLLYKDAVLRGVNHFLTQTSSIMVTLIAFAVFSSVEGKVLTPEEVFTSLALFGQLTIPLLIFPITIPTFISAKISKQRLTKFFSSPEVDREVLKRIDNEDSAIVEFEEESGSVLLHVLESKADKKYNARDTELFLSDSDEDLVGDRSVAVELKDASFSWDSYIQQTVLHKLNVIIPAGKLSIIIGPVGSGKTSLIMAFLGEMFKMEGEMKWSRNSAVAYVPQKPWLINATLQENILFGQLYDPNRYNRVITACALQPDIDLLPGGDMTEIGENGVNLSGGQKQRIAIARALYSHSRTVLMDDPLSALDAQVGLKVFEEGIRKLLLHYHRTVILVTHRHQLLPYAAKIIKLEDGKINIQGSFDEIGCSNPELCSSWKQSIFKEEEECRKDDEKLSKERWKLLRLLSKQPFLRTVSLIESNEIRKTPQLFMRQMSCDTGCPVLLDGYLNEDSSSLLAHSHSRIGSSHSFLRQPFELSSCQSGSSAFKSSRQYLRMLSNKSDLSHHVLQEEEQEKEKPDETKAKLIVEEERVRGEISKESYFTYFQACGLVFVGIVLFLFISTQAVNMGKDFWLSDWSESSKDHKQEEGHNTHYYLTIYVALSIGAIFLSLCSNMLANYCGCRAQKQLHRAMLENVVQCKMRFFDTTPIGRIINRFSSDVATVDKNLPIMIQMLLRFLLPCIAAVIVNAIGTPYCLLIAVPVMGIYYWIQNFFRNSSRELQRLDSIAKSPVFAFFSETLSGLITIRAFRDERKFFERIVNLINNSILTFLILSSGNRWLGIVLDYLGSLIMFAATIFAITASLHGYVSPSFVGLTMSYTLLIPVYLNWVVRHLVETEMCMSSVERIKQYSEVSPEDYQGVTVVNNDWPSKGEVKFQNVSLRYDSNLDPVATNITLLFKAGEKIGICGRTGSGKSSLIMGLFRIIDICEGNIFIDDIDIKNISLSVLRSRIAIIPQEAALFTGTVRFNLDPKNEFKDGELWQALEMAQLKKNIESFSNGLDTEITGGENFSIGQSQLFCLARVILKPASILVMDEATASLDTETDNILQKIVRTAFLGCTIITIAHRLTTILDYDKIVVMDAGKVAEFGAPSELLANSQSIFSSLLKANE